MSELKWWQTAVFYQIYPRSFADSNGDGIGDLQGIIAKLDYLKTLGIGAIWLSPHFPSPLVDCGYDVSDYRGVAQEYGKPEDFKRLLDEAHQRNIKIVLDMVFNHTSDQHAWFIESKSSKDNPKRDWYIWKKGNGKNPPNNWYSTFGGSAWEYDAYTDECYYHFFFKEQPDLNWRNPQVKEAMWNEVRFWLDMGVDGFRLDAIGTIFEDPRMPNQNAGFTLEDLFIRNRKAKTDEERAQIPAYWEELFHYQHDQPGIHELMKELRQVVDEYDDRVLIGETDDIQFYGNGDNELHLVFNFPLMRLETLTSKNVRKNQIERLKALPKDAWPCNTLGNHDCPRMFIRFGDGKHDAELAKLHLAMLLTLKGTPVLYNGEEIGMSDLLITDPRQYQDPLSTRNYQLEMQLMGTKSEEAILVGAREGRDKNRTPMQWSNGPNAGFCPENAKPWLPINPDYRNQVNVADQEKDSNSLLNFYRKFISFRQSEPTLVYGEYEPHFPEGKNILAYVRRLKDSATLVLLNFSDQPSRISIDDYHPRQVVFTHQAVLKGNIAQIEPFGILIIKVG
jgi:alpha-glucosidase